MQKQRLQQQQKLQLSPQQIQFLGLLQIPVVSLEKRIEEELEDNPALEEEEQSSEDISDSDWESQSYRTNSPSEEKEKPVIAEREESLQEFLLKQLPLLSLHERDADISAFIIGCLDDNGFLRRELYAISDDFLFKRNEEVSEHELARLLKEVQSLDPAGVGARNLQECLLIQLERLPASDAQALAIQLLQEQYEAFSRKNYDKILRELAVDEPSLKAAVEQIAKLNPKPGSSFANSQEGTSYVTPDFFLSSQEGELQLQLNQRYRRQLGPSKQYQQMLKGLKSEKDQEAIAFIQQKLEAAQWFANALQQREHTLMNTMQCILNLQEEYFKSGDEKLLKPMKLMDVAQKVHLDISTVSRVTNSKYIETPFGTFLLKHFFSEAYHKEDGTSISNKVVKSHLEEILEKEDKRQPLTDEQLAELLDEKGYHIARRTVAKYREQMDFPVARLRKEL
jgi:RNA polymerase sigma-54 factor